MNFFKKLFYSLTFIFIFVAPQNSFGMEEKDDMGKIIILAGTSCTGKTTIAKAICAQLDFEYVAQDEISDEVVEQFEDEKIQTKLDAEQYLVLEKAKEFASQGQVVVCDIVPLNSLDEPILEEIIQQTEDYPTYKIFIHTPYDQLMQQVEIRNDLAKKTNSPEETRSAYAVTKQFLESHQQADIQTSPSKKIPVRMTSPDIEKRCIQASPPNSPLLEARLFGAAKRNLFPNKEREILCITPIEKYDYLFQNNKYDPNRLKPANLSVLMFAIQEWLKTATKEWENSLDNELSDTDTSIDMKR